MPVLTVDDEGCTVKGTAQVDEVVREVFQLEAVPHRLRVAAGQSGPASASPCMQAPLCVERGGDEQVSTE